MLAKVQYSNAPTLHAPTLQRSTLQRSNAPRCNAPRCISSDETLDRYSEIIQASGWKLSSYHRNPVFQDAHQYGDGG